MTNIEFGGPVNPKSVLLSPTSEPTFVFLNPRPGLEALGIELDTERGSYTIVLEPQHIKFIIENLDAGWQHLEAMRLEALFRGKQDDGQ